MPTKPVLPIYDMDQRHVGLTKPIADSYTEAATVCLDRHHHSPTEFHLDRSGSRSATTVQWPSTDARARGAWANTTDATEQGAYACALAAVELAAGLVAVRRAETMTELLVLARELRQASAARELGSLGLVGGAWQEHAPFLARVARLGPRQN